MTLRSRIARLLCCEITGHEHPREVSTATGRKPADVAPSTAHPERTRSSATLAASRLLSRAPGPVSTSINKGVLPIAAAAFALTAIVVVAGAQRPALEAATMPFHAVAPLIATDDAPGTVLVLATATPSQTPTATPTPANACGSGHASLLTLSDPGAATIVREPQDATVAFLRTQTRPTTVPTDATRSAPVETSVYTVDVVLVSMSEAPNYTIHLVVADPNSGDTFATELPDKNCTTKASPEDRGHTLNAHTALRLACGNPSSTTRLLRGTATITGVGYWGAFAAEGAAPNGIELGPLLAFEYTDSASCDPAHYTPTPEPTAAALKAISISVNPGYAAPFPVHPGESITGTVITNPHAPGDEAANPPVPDLECNVQYVGPGTVGDVLNDPALAPKTTGADGTATWTWTIPTDSPTGTGHFEAHCGPKMAATNVFVSEN